ncbi:ATP synthase F0 subunit C [Armatimonas sp.]|uniref:ATP synthase F0 subunit C n=1 Tax=Armatimonas sp. TaxID=1872638 RepID=UPI00286BAE29|nr:ATP synthase F0 subunit C [Armatimonas sp.]
MIYFGLLGLGLAIGLPIAVIGAGMGQGRAAAAALEGAARQPEMAGKLQTMMIIALAIIESLVIYALVMFFILMGKLPSVDAETVKAALLAGK